ncbi:hypothetical protein, partial [Cellulomonas bogoriensis]|uniref:hypothetical protein n=1 Tax=Cellulomonas bogoriensis TaxID=301388 RepID=UPI00054E79F4
LAALTLGLVVVLAAGLQHATSGRVPVWTVLVGAATALATTVPHGPGHPTALAAVALVAGVLTALVVQVTALGVTRLEGER